MQLSRYWSDTDMAPVRLTGTGAASPTQPGLHRSAGLNLVDSYSSLARLASRSSGAGRRTMRRGQLGSSGSWGLETTGVADECHMGRPPVRRAAARRSPNSRRRSEPQAHHRPLCPTPRLRDCAGAEQSRQWCSAVASGVSDASAAEDSGEVDQVAEVIAVDLPGVASGSGYCRSRWIVEYSAIWRQARSGQVRSIRKAPRCTGQLKPCPATMPYCDHSQQKAIRVMRRHQPKYLLRMPGPMRPGNPVGALVDV
jgi:hypothetical protein